MKLSEINPAHTNLSPEKHRELMALLERGKIYYRRFVMELGTKLATQMMLRPVDGSPWHLRGEAPGDEISNYVVDIHFGDKHPAMFVKADFPKKDVAFRKKITDAVEKADLRKFESSEAIDHGFYTATFIFVREKKDEAV